MLPLNVLEMVPGVIMLLIAVLWLVPGIKYDDEMFRRFGVAYVMFGVTRIAHVAFRFDVTNGFDWWRLVVLGVYGIANALLVAGALNGGRMYRETPWVVGVAAVVSAVMSSLHPIDSLSAWFPMAVALSVGNFFAAVFVLRRSKRVTGTKCCIALDFVAFHFFLRAALSLLSPFVLYDGLSAFRFELFVMDVLMLVGMFASGAYLLWCRNHRSICEE